jgi:hypothetical protein
MLFFLPYRYSAMHRCVGENSSSKHKVLFPEIRAVSIGLCTNAVIGCIKVPIKVPVVTL